SAGSLSTSGALAHSDGNSPRVAARLAQALRVGELAAHVRAHGVDAAAPIRRMVHVVYAARHDLACRRVDEDAAADPMSLLSAPEDPPPRIGPDFTHGVGIAAEGAQRRLDDSR